MRLRGLIRQTFRLHACFLAVFYFSASLSDARGICITIIVYKNTLYKNTLLIDIRQVITI